MQQKMQNHQGTKPIRAGTQHLIEYINKAVGGGSALNFVTAIGYLHIRDPGLWGSRGVQDSIQWYTQAF